MPDQIKYYFKEDTNQILVSGSSTKGGMNALLTSSKSPTPNFDPHYTAKISSLGTSVSYVVPSGNSFSAVPAFTIPIQSNQELWIYRNYQPVGVQDANAFRYNPHIHRPYKAYILTETGSGKPIEPWLPAGVQYYGSYTTAAPGSQLFNPASGRQITGGEFDDTPFSFNSNIGFITQELGLNGNYINTQNESGTYPPPNGLLTTNAFSGSFEVFSQDRIVYPYLFTRYTQGGFNAYGSAVYLYREGVSTPLIDQTFDSNTDMSIVPTIASDDIKFNSLTAASVTTMSLGSTVLGPSLNELLSRLDNADEIPSSKEVGKIRVESSTVFANFLTFNIERCTLKVKGNLKASSPGNNEVTFGFEPLEYLLKTTVGLFPNPIVLNDTQFTTSGGGTGAQLKIYYEYKIGIGITSGYYITKILAGNTPQNSQYVSGDTITITAATLDLLGFTDSSGDITVTINRGNIDQLAAFNYTPSQYFLLYGSYDSESSGFNMFTNNEDLKVQIDGSYIEGTLIQGQYFGNNNNPLTFPNIELINGNYTFTSSEFQDIDVSNNPSTGSTQFGLTAEYDYYVRYKAELSTNSISSVTLTYTGSNNTGEYFTLQPNQQGSFTAVPGTVSVNPNPSSAIFSLDVIATSPRNSNLTDPEGIFSTRVNDVYINYSSSLTQSIDGLYVFNQLPQNDVQVTASMFLNAWTGSDDGAKYGNADYGTDIYGEGEEGDGPTWPTASMRIYTGSYPNNVPGLTSDFVTESLFLDKNIHVNGLAVTMSYLIPSESIQIKDCLSLSLAVTSSQPLSEIDNSLIVSEYKLEFNTPTASREGDGRVPTFIENAFEGTLGFSNTPDCQPLLNNTFEYRRNGQIQEIDYTTDIVNPINFQQILSGSAVKSSVPESNYNTLAWILNRYLGSKSSANQVNSISGLRGGYGKTPVIDYKRAYIAYCDQIIDPYPTLNNHSQFNLKYLVNGQGDALNPLLSPYTALDVEGVWDEGGLGNVSVNQVSGSSQYDQLNGFQTTTLVAKQPLPVLYSQTSSDGYASFIPLDGNPNFVSSFEQEFMQYSMRIQGSVFDNNDVNSYNPRYLNLLAGITGSNKQLNPAQVSSTFLNRFGEFKREDGTQVNGAVAPPIIVNGETTTPGSGFPLSPAQWTGSDWFLNPGADPGVPTYNNDASNNPYKGAPGEIFFTIDPVASASAAGYTSLSDDYKITLDYTQTQTLPNRFRTRVGQGGSWSDPNGSSSQYGSGRIGEIKLYFQKTNQPGDQNSDTDSGWTRQKFKFRTPPTITVYFGNITSTNEVTINGDTLVLNVAQVSSDEGFRGSSGGSGGGGWQGGGSGGSGGGSGAQYWETGIYYSQIQNAITSAGKNVNRVAYIAWNFQVESDVALKAGTRYRWKAVPTATAQNQSVINSDGEKNYFNPNRIPVTGVGLTGGSNNQPINFQVPVKGPFFNMAITCPSAEDNTEDNAINSPYWEFSQSLQSVDYAFVFTQSTSTSNPPFSGDFNDIELGLPNLSFDNSNYSNVSSIYIARSSSLGESIASDINQINSLPNGSKGFIQIGNVRNSSQFFTGSITSAILPYGTAPNQYWKVNLDTPQNVFLDPISNLANLSIDFTKGNPQLENVRNTLLLKDENGNISYNDEYYIGYLPYKPGPTPSFPGGEEPTDTAWPRPNLEWNVLPNDEIRFVNTEGQSYKIVNVVSPKANLILTGVNKLKLTLDREVSNGVNIQFFLIRRNVYSPNTVIVDKIFPYGSLPQLTKWVDSKNTEIISTGSADTEQSWTDTFPPSQSMTENASGSYISYIPPLRKQDNTPSGFLFPEFPIAKLEITPDEVLRDLRDKKLID